jgi:YD repeat-containing protein
MSLDNRVNNFFGEGLIKTSVVRVCVICFAFMLNNANAFYMTFPPLDPELHMLWFDFALDQEEAISKCESFVRSQGYSGNVHSYCAFYGEVTPEWQNYWKVPGAEVGMKTVSFGWLVEQEPFTKGSILYLPSNYCPSPYKYNHATKMCEALCEVGDTWNATLKRCESEPTQRNDCTKTANPIDLVDGAKYRRESVMSIGTSFPIELIFHYNNFRNREKTVQGGRRPLVASDDYNISVGSTHNRIVNYYVADQIPPMIAGDSNISLHNDWGILASEEAISEPYRGDMLRYWRHNYDESLVQNTNGTFTWLQSNGEDVALDAAGRSTIYPRLLMTEMSVAEYGYSGHALSLSNGQKKIFDDRGRLRRVIDVNGIYHQLEYNDDDHLIRISHSLGGYLELSYTQYEVSSIYATSESERPHLTRVSDSAGRHVDIEWDDAITSDKQYYVITSLTAPYTTEPASARVFNYIDPRWHASMTDIYETYNGTRHHYAHFEYDDHGRAVLSQLSDEVDKVTVEYPDDLTRVITNALGKQSTYRFAQFNGVKRLASVTGEATSQCYQSDTTYDYDDSGNVVEKNVNGVITTYDYNSHNLEIRRTEAAGTPVQRMVTSAWDNNLRQPLTVSYPGQTVTYTYDSEGRLLSKTENSVQ